MSVYSYYNWTADQYRPVKLQLYQHTLCFCHNLYVFSTFIAFTTGPHSRCQFQQVQTDCSVHNLGAAFSLHTSNPLFYLHFLFAPSPYYPSHTLPTAHTSGGLAAGNDKRLLSGKMWMQSVNYSCIAVLVRVSFVRYWPSVVVSQFFFSFTLCLQTILLFVTLSSGSAQLSYHLRPDLLSTLFLSTLSPISSPKNKGYSRIAVCTAVPISHRIILHFVSLNSYSPHAIYLKYKLYILRGQHKERNHSRDVGIDLRVILKYMLNKFSGRRGGTFWIRPIQDMHNCWAVVHTAMNLPVTHLLTGCGAVGFPSSTVLHVVCWLLYVLVRRMAYSLCVVLCCVVLCCVVLCLLCCVVLCCTDLCCVVLYRFVLCCVVLYRFVLCCVVPICVVLCCVVSISVHTILPYSTNTAPHSPQPIGTDTNYL